MTSLDLCTRTLQELAGLQLHLQVCASRSREAEESPGSGTWISAADLRRPDSPPLSCLLGRFATAGSGTNRRLASASFLLRFGWASGFTIAAYLACGRVPVLHDHALLFAPSSLLHTLSVREVSFHTPASGSPGARRQAAGTLAPPGHSQLRRHLLESLWELSAPVIEAQHVWSRYSRQALWSMVASSWGALFTSLGRQLGDAPGGIAEARALFALHPELVRAAPELYEVSVADAACTCQRRAACCLYFKRPGQTFCASCPLLTEVERLERNHRWVRERRPVVCA